MNFCVAILILTTEGNTQHLKHIMLDHFKEGKNATETHKNISAVCGEGAVTDRTCQKWFAKVCAGDFSLDDAPRSGRPAEVDSDPIETLIENSKHYTTQVITDILKMSTSSKVIGENEKCVFYHMLLYIMHIFLLKFFREK